jgi:hypothetical protein
LTELAPSCKHDSFKEEEEWRIYAHGGDMQSRASLGKIVPYQTVDVTSVEDERLMAIEEIITGPKNNRLDSERSLMYLASAYGYGHSGIAIYASEAPYR